MVVSNTSDKDQKPDWSYYAERIKGFTQARNITTGKVSSLSGLEIDSHDSYVFELLR
jgi:hypothetical protein